MSKRIVGIGALKRAIRVVGGQSELARRVSRIGRPKRIVTQNIVSNWLRRYGVPPEFARVVEAATEGKVTRYQLRPDVFGKSPDDLPRDDAA